MQRIKFPFQVFQWDFWSWQNHSGRGRKAADNEQFCFLMTKMMYSRKAPWILCYLDCILGWLLSPLFPLPRCCLLTTSLATGQLHVLSENKIVQTPANWNVFLQHKLGSGILSIHWAEGYKMMKQEETVQIKRKFWENKDWKNCKSLQSKHYCKSSYIPSQVE